jgi:hypothetical protein
MKRIGWDRPNKSGTLRFGPVRLPCFVRGKSREEICVVRKKGQLLVGTIDEIEGDLHDNK